MTYALVTVIVGMITYLACLAVSFDGILGLVFKMLICLGLPNLIYLLVYKNTKIYKEAIKFIKNMLPKKLKKK